MLERILLLPLLASTAAFACAASTKCLPDVYARQFTLMKGNADAAMVQEYSTSGCYEIKLDSIVRRSVSPESLRVQKSWTDDPSKSSPAVTIYASYSTPKLDSAQTAVCAKVRTIRRIDSIPRASIPIVLPGSDLSGETPVPVNPDSVYACLNGSCSKIIPRVVENVANPEKCLEGALSPLASAEDAFQYLKSRIKEASSVSRLRRIRIVYLRLDCPVVVYDYGARAASMLPVYVKETRLSYTNWNSLGLPALRDWTDTTISKRLALPSRANAGDFYAPETLLFHRTAISGNTDQATTFRYPTGVEQYFYRGTTLSPYQCSDAIVAPPPASSTIGDSLRLEGLSLNLSTSTDCPVKGIDMHASQNDDWLFAPTSEANLQNDFFHGANAQTPYSWPIANDSVLVGGQKVPLARLAALVSTLPRPEERRFTARVADGALSLTLENSARVRVAGADGRILSISEAPAGASRIALPGNHHGILLVTSGNRTLRVPAP